LEGRLLGFTRQGGKWHLTGPIIEPRNEKADGVLEALIVKALHALIEHGEIAELDNELARELVGELPLGKKPSVLSAGVARPLTELFVSERISHRDGLLGLTRCKPLQARYPVGLRLVQQLMRSSLGSKGFATAKFPVSLPVVYIERDDSIAIMRVHGPRVEVY
jgi:hypothetical protein